MPQQVQKKTSNINTPSLGKLTIPFVDENGVEQKVPALDKRWITRTVFARYVGLMAADGSMKTGAELDEWQYKAQCFGDDMEYLLTRPHHVFWSYLVYQKTALASIVTFLQRATPFYLELFAQTPKPPALHLYEQLLAHVLRIICRMLTAEESPEAWIEQSHLRELIYKNYLISVPMLFDLLVAIGNANLQNAAALRKIFATLLEIEPQYKQDLLAALAFFRAAFRSIQTQTENEGFEGAGGGVLDAHAETPYDDVALYTLDCAYSLSVLMEVCPELRPVCGEIKLAKCIAHFYDTTIPFLYKNICLVNEGAASLSWLNQARLQFLKAFRNIAYSYIETVLAQPKQSLLPSENFIGLLTECLSEQTFVIDYERQYPVVMDVDILKQACKNLDDFKADFVVKGYHKEAEDAAAGTIGNVALSMQDASDFLAEFAPVEAEQAPQEFVETNNESVAHNSGRDMDAEVSAVLEVLPDLGTGFVRRVLTRYDRSEDAIAAILEENLPPDLLNADRSEVYIPADPQDKLYQQTGIRHLNVYDGDAYDILTQDNPQCLIKQGKGFPNAPQNASQLLDDKSDLQAIRHRYQEYALVTEGGGDSDQDEYEDEYDDSYEALLESETRTPKSKELQAGLANVLDQSESEPDNAESSDERETANTDGKNDNAQGRSRNRMDFCENPEITRARYEAKRQAKWGNRRNDKGTDVVGAPKGHGQDKDTVRSRNKKEVNKASRANHNRKSGAAFKRSKGMMA